MPVKIFSATASGLPSLEEQFNEWEKSNGGAIEVLETSMDISLFLLPKMIGQKLEIPGMHLAEGLPQPAGMVMELQQFSVLLVRYSIKDPREDWLESRGVGKKAGE